MEWQDLIKDGQCGEIKGRSYLTNLIHFFKEVIKCIDGGRAVDVVYKEFSGL